MQSFLQLGFIKLKLYGETNNREGRLLCIVIFFLFLQEAVNTSIRSFQIFYCMETLVQNDSGENISVVKQQRCTLLLRVVDAVGMRAVYSLTILPSQWVPI